MKSLYSCFGILLSWSLLASKSNSLPDAKKAFTLFNALNNYQNNIGPYGASPYSGVDPFYETLIRGSTYPTSMSGYSSMGGYSSKGGYYYKLKYAVDKLVKDIGELRSQYSVCNPLMPAGSVVIGSMCYYVSSTPATFDGALQKCRSYGGTLAEPTPSFSNPLWTALISAFPYQMATILGSGTPWLWIGGEEDTGSGTFTYVSTGNNIVPSPTFSSPPPSSLPAVGALMQAPGHPWKGALQTDLNPYVCWSIPLSPAGSPPYKKYRPYPGSYNPYPGSHDTYPGSYDPYPGSYNPYPGSYDPYPGSHDTYPGSYDSYPGSHDTYPGSYNS